MQGICINEGSSSNLVDGQQYYLFEHSKTHYYASLFNRAGSFFGIYRKTLFEVMEVIEEAPVVTPQPAVCAALKAEVLYSAIMISDYGEKLKPMRRKGDTFYLKVRPARTHALYYADPQMTQLRGCSLLNNFDSFVEHSVEIIQPRSIEEISAEMKMFRELDDYDSRNTLVNEYKEAFEALSNPFSVGDQVEHLNGRKWELTTIIAIYSNSEVVTKAITAPFNQFRFPEIVEETTEKVETERAPEQLSLF
ncbi:hypothetical protein [Kurthia huakuii]|uniref:hypothetical protein n=1 Tax=Kurthia huakuii TaxID=1421019 RepID=UPI00049624A1|nr:hypothetical protein [Kurthia huakuii]